MRAGTSRNQAPNRRRFLATTTAAACLVGASPRSGVAFEESINASKGSDLAHQLGIVTASAGAQLSNRADGREFSLLELPQILREELDLRVIDLNTSSIPDFGNVTRAYLDRFRAAAEKAGCVITNLKMNQRGIDMNSRDRNEREKAIAEYKRSIDIASQLGCRWVRPLPSAQKPDLEIHVASYQELCDYGGASDVQLLVENFGWMQSDSGSVVELIRRIGHNVAAGVDIGNWNTNELRYEGLRRSFPLAVTCDFKARAMGPKGEHQLYDLGRCFRIAWEAGFRGPWCFEHANRSTADLLRELGLLRDMIRTWTTELQTKAKSQKKRDR